MLSKIKDLKTVLILVLIGVVVFMQFKGCSVHPDKPTVVVEIDTVYQEVKVEVPKYTPKYITKIEEKEVRVEIPATIDTVEILKDYYAKYKVVDTVALPYPDSAYANFGYGIITDIVHKNSLAQRSIVWNYKIPTITKTITIYEPPRTQVYLGIASGFNAVNFVDNVGAGVILKTKQDDIYQVSFGLANAGGAITPYLGGGIFWKIRLRKPKILPTSIPQLN